ncbi:integrase [Shewanella sp. SM87]|uniref:integrase n=1 Tax=Shewanella sp. SM87 TaxID=2912808 RepID=UPI0021DB0C36|nr:integrase [Shewanella sp. SM87]MCU8010055.1 integrase [Shewanella sp. SM87]
MSENIIIFKSHSEIDHEQNVNDFITFAHKLPLINNKYDYESNYWPRVVHFTRFGVSSKSRNSADLLHESVISFAKAYIAYGPWENAAILTKIYAMRAINNACIPLYGHVDFTRLSAGDLDKAVQHARESLGQGALYNAGRGLKLLLDFLISKKMIKPFVWKNPVKKAAEMNSTSAEIELARQKKMPDENALMGIAQISSAKDHDLSARDLFTTSTMVLLLSAPSRASELFYLKADCVHTERMTVRKALALGFIEEDIKPILPLNYDESIPYLEQKITLMGIKWFGGKGYGHENKWLPTIMYPADTVAFDRLKRLSAEARSFAKLLEESDEFPRHRLCPDVPENQLLTSMEVCLALGLDLPKLGVSHYDHYSIRNFMQARSLSRKQYTYTLRDLNLVIRNRLPEDFPYVYYKTGMGKVKVKWSEALFCGFANSLNIQSPTCHTELCRSTIGTINEDLAPTKKVSRKTKKKLTGTLSLFQRWGLGSLCMTSHQLRHMLDTMAAVNGMAGDLRAKWAQRSDPKHNRYYDHTTPEEYGQDFIEDRENEIAETNSKSLVQVQIATPRTIQELNTKAGLTTHYTEFGMCIHSYLSEPCVKYRDCINCNEQVCVKGEDDKCDRIRQRLAREIKMLEKDKKNFELHVPGAERWYSKRIITVQRCEALLKLMEDPNIEDGSLIRLHIPDVTLLDRAMDINIKKRLPEIINYKRLATVSVDEMLDRNILALDSDDELFSNLDDFDDFDYDLGTENG